MEHAESAQQPQAIPATTLNQHHVRASLVYPVHAQFAYQLLHLRIQHTTPDANLKRTSALSVYDVSTAVQYGAAARFCAKGAASCALHNRPLPLVYVALYVYHKVISVVVSLGTHHVHGSHNGLHRTVGLEKVHSCDIAVACLMKPFTVQFETVLYTKSVLSDYASVLVKNSLVFCFFLIVASSMFLSTLTRKFSSAFSSAAAAASTAST